jgi:tetratricopeptide (TPR) repeat protein
MSDEIRPWDPDHDRASRLCDEANELKDAGERIHAERLLREAVSLDPSSSRPHVLLGALLGDTPAGLRAGIRELRRALELSPDDPRALTRLGSLLMQNGRYAEAEPMLERSLALRPTPWTCVYLGVCVAALRRQEAALAYYRQALDLDPDYEEAEYNLGCLLRFSDPSAAERHFRRAVEIDPVYTLAWGELGHVLLVQGRTREAAEALDRAVTLGPEHVWHQLRLAVTLARSGSLSEADQHMRAALQLRHSVTSQEHLECLKSELAAERAEPWSRLYRAFLLGRRFDHDRALALLEGAPEHSLFQSLRAALRADQALWAVLDAQPSDDPAGAIARLELAVGQEPTHPEAWEELGKRRYGLAVDVEAGRRRSEIPLAELLFQAKQALETSLSLAPDRPFAHLYLGLTHKKNGLPDLAEAELRRAAALGDEGVHGAVLGDHLADLDRFEEAEAVLERTLEDYPECAMAWCDYGRTLIRDRHPAGDRNLLGASRAFERAVELEPDRADYHYRLGNALSCLDAGDLDRARAHLKRCIELRPDHEKAIAALADIERA